MNAIDHNAIAAAIDASNALGLAGSSQLVRVVRTMRPVDAAVAALVAADADFAERCARLLSAHWDASFQADVISGEDATSPMMGRLHLDRIADTLALAAAQIVEAMDDIRRTVATERGLWDGADPAAIDLITTRRLIAEHRRDGAASIVAAARPLPLFMADAEGRN